MEVELLDSAVLHTDTLRCSGWQTIGILRCVCMRWRVALSSPETWRLLCDTLATEAGLYSPLPLTPPAPTPTCTSTALQTLFWDHLYPARFKWRQHSGADLACHDFKIQVAVRFRAGEQQTGRRVVLPLHQRLRARKKGEMLEWGVQSASQALPVGALLHGNNQPLQPEALQALLEAQALSHEVHAVHGQSKQNSISMWNDQDGDLAQHPPGGDGENVAPNENIQDLRHNSLGAELNGLSLGDKSHLDPSQLSETNGKGTVKKSEEAVEEDAPNGRRRDSPCVVAVQSSRVVMYVPGAGVRPFHFSSTFEPSASQEEVYCSSARPAVAAALNGFNACIMCYGPTGTGKTHTLYGPPDVLSFLSRSSSSFTGGKHPLPASCGVVLRTFQEIFSAASQAPAPHQQEQACSVERSGEGVHARMGRVSVCVQYVQIYQNSVSDLVSGRSVRVVSAAESSGPLGAAQVHLQGACEVEVGSMEEVVEVLQIGERRKRVAATACNDHSSRAHTLLLLTLTQVHEGRVLRSCLHLVDLAGCEKIKKSKVQGQNQAEAVGINSSLMVLSKCIGALVERKSHVPYHEARLTLLLRAAFGGNSRTTVLITGSKADNHADATLQALRFGENCCMISNQTRVATSSIEEAIAEIQSVLDKCRKEIHYLEAQGKSNMPYFEKLNEHYNQLLRKYQQLSDMHKEV